MLLAIDAGNTNIVIGLFKDETLVGQWRLSTDPRKTADEYALALTQLMQLENIAWKTIQSAIISTVVPGALFALKKVCKQYFGCEPMVVGDGSVNIGINILIENASEVGADRLVNSVAAFERYGGNCIIIDFGTATTFDVINRQGDYMGGMIAPGINLSMDALHRAAAKLPKVAIKRPSKIIGTSTVTAMQSGVFFGYLGLIEGIVSRIIKEYGAPMHVVATGGLAALFAKETDIIKYLEPDLTMYGLHTIFKRNL